MTHQQANPVYRTAQWRRVRLEVLDRDGGICRIKGPTCTGAATAVDHIIRPEDGGAWYDPSNLRACCTNCNNWRAAQTKRRQQAEAAGYSNPGW